MRSVLRAFWSQLTGPRATPPHPSPGRGTVRPGASESATVFIVLRRMRTPLITLLLVISVSVLGLTLIPGQDAAGHPARLSFFDAFYFMSYTASTIGFGELPNTFTYAQRLWVVGAIYSTVVAWAYAIGALLTLLQDRAFRRALALRHVTRKVARLREPFLVIAGYGEAGETLGRSFDELGRRFTVVDLSEERIDALELNTHHADVPGLVADARDPRALVAVGLQHPFCDGVVALTNDDEANLAVTMAAALLRPEVPVVSRTTSAVLAERMTAFGSPTVVNPFDRFGDRLRLALRAPASYQLSTWLEGGPGAELPERRPAPPSGRWVVCGYGRFGRHFAADLRDAGIEVTTVDPLKGNAGGDPPTVLGDATDPDVLDRTHLPEAVAFVAGTDNDTTNLSLVADARRRQPGLFVAARQNQKANAPLFEALGADAVLVPQAVVASDVYAQLSSPLLWRFLRTLPDRDDAWSAALVERLTGTCGTRLDALWKVRLDADGAPSLVPWLEREALTLGDLLRSPADRAQRLEAVALLVARGDEALPAPGDDLVLHVDDELLLAGRPAARRDLGSTLLDVAAPPYLVTGQRVPASWIWRKLTRAQPVPVP